MMNKLITIAIIISLLVGGGLVYKDYQKTKQQVIANQQNIQIIVDFINKSIEASKNPQNMVQ